MALTASHTRTVLSTTRTPHACRQQKTTPASTHPCAPPAAPTRIPPTRHPTRAPSCPTTRTPHACRQQKTTPNSPRRVCPSSGPQHAFPRHGIPHAHHLRLPIPTTTRLPSAENDTESPPTCAPTRRPQLRHSPRHGIPHAHRLCPPTRTPHACRQQKSTPLTHHRCAPPAAPNDILPDTASHMRTVLSLDPDTTRLPSAENDTKPLPIRVPSTTAAPTRRIPHRHRHPSPRAPFVLSLR